AESDHPLAQAVVKTYPNVTRYPVSQTQVMKGSGIIATVKGVKAELGNLQSIKNNQIKLGPGERARSEQLQREANYLVLMDINNQLGLILGIKDQIRPNVKSELLRHRKLGVKNLILLSGDNQGKVNQVAQNLRLTEAKGNMMPEDKAAYITELQKKGQN